MRLRNALGARMRAPGKCAAAMAVQGRDQLWVADIACIRLLTEFTSEGPVLLVLPIAY